MTTVEQEEQEEAPAPSGGLGRKILVATLIGALVFAGLSMYGDVQALRDNLSAFRWEMLGLAVALATGNYLLRFLRWQYYLTRIGCPTPVGESFLIFLSGFVMSVTPGKVGEVFKSLLLLESQGYSVVKTAPVVVAERLTDLMALVILTAIGALSFPQGIPITIAGTALVSLIVAGCAIRPFSEFGFAMAGRMPVIRGLVPRLREAYESLHSMTRLGPLVYATLLSTLSWGLEVVGLGVILSGFDGVSLGWEATSFAYSASTIAGALAMMPGGLGVTEAGMTGLLQALGDESMTPAVATAATMLVRLATLWWAVVVGVVALAAYRRRAKVSEAS
ncbi:MAG: flippase-like domain-containing protein [Deltaproteobacteria bacterium]|nr:flippase-like domain-containing protein [Deltaproteobacteria bacterium]